MATSSILHYVKLFLVSRNRRTLEADEVALVFREPGIKSGYRPSNRPWMFYLASSLQVNNETVNIWSHLVGFLLMVYYFFKYSSTHDIWTETHIPAVLSYTFCCVTYTFLSTVAHTFHSKSDFIHYISFQMDYGGVGIYTYGAGILVFYISCSDEVLYKTLHPVFLPLNTLMAFTSCLCCCYAKLRYSRPYPFRRRLWQLCSVGLHTIFVFSGILKRYYDLFVNGAEDGTISHHSGYISLCCLSIFFFASHLPEKRWPGKFDFLGQGHQLFHVLIVITSILELSAADADMRELKVGFRRTFPTCSELIASFAAVIVLDLIAILFLMKFTRKRIKKDRNKTLKES